MELRNRTILITGAAQGLGLGIARRLAAAGARLVLVDCDPVVKDHLADPIFAKSAIAMVRDLAEPDAPRDLIRPALEKVESLNGLINCAAWSLHKALAETTIGEFDRLVAINQRAPFFLSQEFAKAIEGATHDACIVNIASVNASVGNAYLTGYASTKGALVAMGRAMAVELAPRIRPGPITT
jgi:glucose 1-dehydrogenase